MNRINMSAVRLSFTPWTPDEDLHRTLKARWLRGATGAEGSDAVVLGHAFDGVLWGVLRGGVLTMANEVSGDPHPRLRAGTLMDLRVFGGLRELRIWRAGERLCACEVHEVSSEASGSRRFEATRNQSYALLGSHRARAPSPGNFVVLRGTAGQQHTPPGLLPDGCPPERLDVRHYYTRDDEGLLRIAEHRLLGLSTQESRP